MYICVFVCINMCTYVTYIRMYRSRIRNTFTNVYHGSITRHGSQLQHTTHHIISFSCLPETYSFRPKFGSSGKRRKWIRV